MTLTRFIRVSLILLALLGFAGASSAQSQNPSSANLYTYCNNDPVNCTDPTGLYAQEVASGAYDLMKPTFRPYVQAYQNLVVNPFWAGVNAIAQSPIGDPGTYASLQGLGAPGAVMAGIGRGTAFGFRALSGIGGATGAAESTATEFNYTRTVLNNVASRPYINSPLTIREIMSTGAGVPDPGGIPGALRFDVPGAFNGRTGAYQLVVQPQTNTIYHFLFTSGP